jgi:hypothetical protein
MTLTRMISGFALPQYSSSAKRTAHYRDVLGSTVTMSPVGTWRNPAATQNSVAIGAWRTSSKLHPLQFG